MKLSCQVLHISHALTVALIYAASLSKCATSLQKSIPPQPTAGDPSKVGLALNSSSSGGVSSNSSLLFDLQALRSQFRPVGDDTPHLDSSIPPALSSKLSGSSSSSRHSALRPLKGKLGSGITIAGAGSSSSTPLASSQPSSAVTPSPIYASECTSLLPDIITMLLTQIKDSLGYVTQQGLVDFGLTGQPGETSVCAPQAEGGCAFSNPSSPYGLINLPLAPEEDAVTKANAATTPKSVSLDLKASTNSLPSATAAAAFRRPVHLAGRLDSSSSNAASSAAPVVPPSGSAPVYQLRPDEVILLMGCLPPANASRYFAFTPYMYTAYDNVTSTWVNVFGSMGDSKSVIRETATCDPSEDACLVSGPYAQYGLRNRLNASLPSDYAALINIMSNGGRHNNAVSANGSASGNTSGATGDSSNADIGSSGLGSGGLTWWWTRWWASRQQGGKGTADQAVSSPVSNTSNGQTFFSNGQAQGKNGSSLSSTTAFGSPAAGSWSDNSSDPAASHQDQPPLMWVPQIPPSAFERFTVVVMSASQEASKNVEEVLNTALKSMDIIDAVNLLPIPTTPFSNNIGLDPESPYYMLLMRNIIPQGQSPLFASYSEAKPWSAWRLTPGTLAAAAASSGTPETLLSAAGKLLGGLAFPSVSESSGGPSSADLPFPNGTVVHSTSYGTYTSFPIPKVVPRTATWLNQSESWLLPAFNYLQNRIQVRHGGGNALAWSLITDSYLAILGIDWGISCVDWLIDACNGDNRDAQYESSYPLVSLDKNSKVLWVVGVNHVATGLATYANVALLDPIQEVGLLAFDDTELPGSSDDLMQGGPFEAMAPFLFSVRFSRNCQGMSYCKTIPSQGANSLPTARPALIMMRSYVNPATGVGPNVTALIPFRTITVTPQSDAGPWDVLARNNPATLANSSCPGDLLGTTLCTASGVQGSECCTSVSNWNLNGCWCDPAGKMIISAIPGGVTAAALLGVAKLCGVRSNVTACS